MFFTGDFNAHSQLWWPDGDTNHECTEIEELYTKLSLSQVMSEPTNFEPNKTPSCIDLIVTDQANIILDSGTRASLDSNCHHHLRPSAPSPIRPSAHPPIHPSAPPPIRLSAPPH